MTTFRLSPQPRRRYLHFYTTIRKLHIFPLISKTHWHTIKVTPVPFLNKDCLFFFYAIILLKVPILYDSLFREFSKIPTEIIDVNFKRLLGEKEKNTGF